MSRDRSGQPEGILDPATPRKVLSELVSGAARETRPPPTDLALRYLVELLEGRLRAEQPSSEPMLAEDLMQARLASGSVRLRRLHALGDRALFVSGFFGDSLRRSLVGIRYYREIGRTAYAELASDLGGRGGAGWSPLFEELADRFRDLADVLAEVGDRSRPARARDLLGLYDRYLETGSPRDRRRIARLGHAVPDLPRHRRLQ